ncbi:SCO family protein [Frankia sp. CiP1_Cm_nod1]|uniref:SCO family protein n=1 Tax=Frankia sp. CiP1_Cm_nod1 TaxID=2897160 RepID=UPI00202594AF
MRASQDGGEAVSGAACDGDGAGSAAGVRPGTDPPGGGSGGSRPRPPARWGPARCRRLFAVPLVVAFALVLAGCSSGTGSAVTIVDDSGPVNELRGTALAQPVDKPALNLTDTAGAPFDLRSRTAGKVTLLFFGYTRCPDVCPTTMADIAAALDTVPASVRSRIATVFVTTDPERDTGEVLDRWLSQFDPSFIGVRGTLAQIRAQADALGIPLADPVRQPSGIFTVTHGTQVMAFTADDRARAVYLAGTQVADYAHDLPILANTGKTT